MGKLITWSLLCAGWIAPVSPGQPASAPTRPAPPVQILVRPVRLAPTTRPASLSTQPTTQSMLGPGGAAPLRYGRWLIHVERADEPAPVPWRVVYQPSPETAYLDAPGQEFDLSQQLQQIPVIRIPAHLWSGWMSGDAAGAVGMHYHQLSVEQQVSILYTIHPAGRAESDQPNSPQAANQHPASQIEATLLTPLRCWVDQTIVVQADRRRDIEASRIEHERGHAAGVISSVLEALAGPHEWDPQSGTAWRSELVWRYRYEKIARTWRGYLDGEGKLLTLRTHITLIPPTHWSITISKPPDQVRQQEILAINQQIISPQQRFEQIRFRQQRQFHKTHPAFEGPCLFQLIHPGRR